jgi:hypothetical protein
LGVRFAIDVDKRIAAAPEVGAHKTSMLQDLERGRPMEIDALLGVVVELAEMVELPAPTVPHRAGLVRGGGGPRGAIRGRVDGRGGPDGGARRGTVSRVGRRRRASTSRPLSRSGESGRYRDAADVVRAALRLLVSHESPGRAAERRRNPGHGRGGRRKRVVDENRPPLRGCERSFRHAMPGGKRGGGEAAYASPPAPADIDGIAVWIAAGGSHARASFTKRLEARCARIVDFPEAARLRPEYGRASGRAFGAF